MLKFAREISNRSIHEMIESGQDLFKPVCAPGNRGTFVLQNKQLETTNSYSLILKLTTNLSPTVSIRLIATSTDQGFVRFSLQRIPDDVK